MKGGLSVLRLVEVLFLVMGILMSLGYGVVSETPQISVTTWIGAEDFGVFSTQTKIAKDLDAEAPITLIKGNTYLLKSEVSLVVFLCIAPYPVDWTFSNSKWMLSHEKSFGIYSTTTKRIVQDVDNPSTFTYLSQIAFLGDSRMYNGIHTCKRVNNDDPRNQGNFTLYWEGGPYDALLVLAGKNVTIYPDNKDRIVFPCHVNNPFANVTLYKEKDTLLNQKSVGGGVPVAGGGGSGNKTKNGSSIEIDQQWTPIKLSDNLKYVPEVGFIFQKRDNIDWMDDGNYKCVSGGDGEDPQTTNDFLLMTFSANSEPNILLDNPIRSGSGARIAQTPDHRQYECCSASDKPPKMTIHSCGSPTSCYELIPALKAQQVNLGMTTMSAAWNRVNIPQFEALMNSVNGSCAYIQSWGGNYDMDVIQCIGDGINVLRKFMRRNPQNLTADSWDIGDLAKWVNLNPSRKNRNFNFHRFAMWQNQTQTGQSILEVYVGEPVIFDVQYPYYFFSHGVRFSVKYNDGTPRNVLPEMEDIRLKQYNLPKNLLMHWGDFHQVSYLVNISKNMESLTCHIPVWNSSQWVIKSLAFSVKVPRPPSIEGTDMEELVLTLNETGKSLECKTSGEPDPKVFWLKDGRSVNGIFNVSRHEDPDGYVKYILIIPKATHEIQGEFKCISDNFLPGRAEKTFNVFVQESRATEITTIVSLTLLILAIMIGGGILIWRTILQRKSLENLRAHVYPEENGNG